jgi:hypothetical protein
MGVLMPEPLSNRPRPGAWSGPNRIRAGSAAAYDTQAPAPAADRSERWYVNDSDRWRGPGRLRSTAPGRLHMWSLLCAHGVLLRHGVVDAVTILTMREVAEAVVACRYFELAELADLVTRVPQAALSALAGQHFDTEYRRLVPNGEVLVDAVRRAIAAHPDDFPAGPG